MIDPHVLKLEQHSLTNYKPICLFFTESGIGQETRCRFSLWLDESPCNFLKQNLDPAVY